MEELYEQHRINEENLVIYEVIGEGTFGKVWRGKLIDINRDVAFKMLKRQDTDPIDKNMLGRELRNQNLLKHTNIVESFGLARFLLDNEIAYGIILEYVNGQDLKIVIENYPICEYETRQVLSWALQAAKGLAYMHSLPETKLIHRDIKPENLLLNRDRTVLKISDFGLARELTSYAKTQTGSKAYMAPEMFKGENYNQCCDVYSWALTFWQCFTRELPFGECTKTSILNRCKTDPEYRLADIPGISPEVQDIITQCSTHERTARPSMSVVIQRLAALQA